VSAPRLRAALTSLHHERRRASSPLTREAERTIGRRVARRWGLGTATITAVGAVVALSWIGGVPASNGDDAGALATPTTTPAEPQAMPAVVSIPLNGGPQYAKPWGELECGDPAPASLPHAPEQRLSLDLTRSGVGDIVTTSLTWAAAEPPPQTRSEPVVSVTTAQLFAVQDGTVVGTILTLDATWGWQLGGQTRAITGRETLTGAAFYCINLDTSGNSYTFRETALDPGTYEVFAITRVFATPESVALFQALEGTSYIAVDERARQGVEVYEPGSTRCVERQHQVITVRACLPGIVPTATLDEDSGTLRMLYDASALPQEFDVTLVSEPVTLVVE